MSRYDYYPEYVPVAERKKQAQKKVEALRKKNPNIAPIVITGRKITRTWWGQTWCDNLESYADYANRIDRGRSYVRNGAVLDLQITNGHITALVQGSSTKPYQIEISIKAMSADVWTSIIHNCAGKINSLQELITGKFPKALTELFTAKGTGLFPAPKDISLQCSCPDSARMCKHVAAVLYGIGARLDDDSSLFFVLRNVNMEELISQTITTQSQAMLEKSKTKGRRVIQEDNLSGMFGIDLDGLD